MYIFRVPFYVICLTFYLQQELKIVLDFRCNCSSLLLFFFILNNYCCFSQNKTLHLRWCKSMKIRRYCCQLSYHVFLPRHWNKMLIAFFISAVEQRKILQWQWHHTSGAVWLHWLCHVQLCCLSGCVLHSLLKQTENWEQWLWLIKRACHH